MAIIPINCGCEDAPCCGCGEVMLTGEDALERMREEGLEMDLAERDRQEERFPTEQEALDNIKQLYGVDLFDLGVDLFDLAVEDRMCGE